MKLEELQGRTLSGRFRLDRLLGKGGYGAVFEAEQLSVGRRCAVKVLFAHLCDDEATVGRFRGEARTTSRLTHPNTVILYDFGRDEREGLLFLAMELLDGRDLTTVIRQNGLLSVDQAVHVTVQMAASLQEAHNLGLVHRDIKPRNVMLLERGNDPMFVKVIDFGIAKVVNSKLLTASDLTQTGTIIGTPKYMAPEQIRDTEIDGRTDMYALAVSVYKMLTGRTPFEEGTALEIAGRQVAEAPEPVSAFHPGLEVSDQFEQVLLKALAKEPVDRFDCVADFARALVEATSGATSHMLNAGMTPTSLPSPSPSSTSQPSTSQPSTSQTNTLPDETPSGGQHRRGQTTRDLSGP
ncbi:MAG: serine/threonine protein kinase, partial [Persicimonas sp.]